MLGRATRLCTEIGKTHFEIYDAVGIYNALAPVSTMKPVVANPATTFDTLIDGIEVLDTEAARQNQVDMIIAKILRNKNKMTDYNREQFASLTGGESPEAFVDNLRNMPTDKAVETIKNNKEAFQYIKGESIGQPMFISDEQDELISHERGYGDATKPEDYLKEFKDFINNNMNEIAALNIVATRPRELTRESLKELKLILDRNNFSETMLQTAWKQMTNEDIAADIISFIRQQSLGDALISKDERIHNAIEKTKKAHPELNNVQQNWLDKIESYLKKETVLNRQSFEAEAFKNRGGYNAINKAFGEKLDNFIEEINNYMYTA
jgi:type I restriction enzyme R subunit